MKKKINKNEWRSEKKKKEKKEEKNIFFKREKKTMVVRFPMENSN